MGSLAGGVTSVLRRRHDLAPVVHIRRLHHACDLGYVGVGDQRRDTGVRLPRPVPALGPRATPGATTRGSRRR